MMGRRRFVALAGGAISLLAFGGVGCAPSSPKTADTGLAPSYTAGTYSATAMGKKGDVVVEADFSDSRIEAVRVTPELETKRIADAAINQLTAQIVDCQTLQLDTVSGATLTSMAILGAMEDCVAQAGGDVKALKDAPGPEASAATEKLEADLVVVGAGASGMAAAVRAAQLGANVVVFEKNGNFGGNMLVSGGVLTYINAPEELRQQNNDGYQNYLETTLATVSDNYDVSPETVDLIRKQAKEWYDAGHTTTFNSLEWNTISNMIGQGGGTWEGTLAYSAGSIPLVEWLTELGIQWSPLFPIGGYPWPEYAAPTSASNGEGYCIASDEEMERVPGTIDILFQTPAGEIIMENGKVMGIKGSCVDGTTYEVLGSHGVVFATGGYSGGPDLLIERDQEWGFKDMPRIPTTNASGHEGDGHRLIMGIGGTMFDFTPNCMLCIMNAQDSSIEGLIGGNGPLVNLQGQRVVNETGSRNDICRAIMDADGAVLYRISDKNGSGYAREDYMGESEESMVKYQRVYRENTLEELAEAIGADKAALVATIEDFNRHAESSETDDLGRSLYSASDVIKEPPFYACPNTWGTHISLDGISTNPETYAVISTTGEEIPGLYAIGELAGLNGVNCMYYGLDLANQMFEA